MILLLSHQQQLNGNKIKNENIFANLIDKGVFKTIFDRK